MILDIKLTEPQMEFMALECKYPAFIAGYGTGKSETMVNSAVADAFHSGNALVACYEPIYDLVKLILAPRIELKLNEAGIRFKYNSSDHIFYSMSNQCGDIIMRSMDNSNRIIGYEAYRSHIDEIDTLTTKKAEDVWNKIVARNRQQPTGIPKSQMRVGKNGLLVPFNRVSAYSTPEGFKFAYKKWGKDPTPSYQMVKASTDTNPFLPDDYIDGLRETYGNGPLIEAYVNGDFVNLTSGSVYYNFNRETCHTNETHKVGEAILVGMDFNVRNMSGAIFVKRDGISYLIDEVTGAQDTHQMAAILKERYGDCTIVAYPDATGKNNSSKNASESDISILKSYGIKVKVRGSNPFIKNRVISLNVAFEKGFIKVNTEKCPNITLALEQQIYDKNGMPQKDTETNIDDLNDAVGYYCFTVYPVIRKVVTAW